MALKLAPALLLLLLAGCAGESATLTPDQPFDPTTMARLDAELTKVMEDNNIPGAVVQIRFPGRGYYFSARGESDTVTHTKMTGKEHFRVGSNTKGFTGTVILQLIDEGHFTLDTHVSALLPNVPNGDTITVRNLLNMTSGLPNYSETDAFNQILWYEHDRAVTRAEMFEWAYAETAQFFPAGTKYHYSNTNTVLLGMIIEKYTGMSCAEAFIERLYKPLGMTQTTWPLTGDLPVPYAHGYTDDQPPGPRHIVEATNWNPNWADAAGQLVSTVDDMAKWTKAMGSGALVSPAMQAQRLTWVTGIPGATGNYGLAIGKSGPWLHHQGELPGYNTIAAYDPRYDATFVCLTNSNVPFDEAGPAQKIVIALSAIVSPP